MQVPLSLWSWLHLTILPYKTSMLMALASDKRVGDIHALSVHPSCTQFAPGHSKVMLRPNAALAMTFGAMSYTSFVFELFPFSPPPFSSEEQQRLHALCPVRALRTYVEQTQDIRLCDQPFVCFANPARRGCSLSSISPTGLWPLAAISLAYSSKRQVLPSGVRTHSTRGLGHRQ